MPTGPKAFLELPDPLKKSFAPYSLVEWGAWQIPWHILFLHRSGRVCPGLADSQSRSVLSSILEPQGAIPPGLILLGGLWFITWCLRRPSLGEYWRGLRHFWSRKACMDYGPALGPTLKRPCAIFVWWGAWQIPSYILFCWIKLNKFTVVQEFCFILQHT